MLWVFGRRGENEEKHFFMVRMRHNLVGYLNNFTIKPQIEQKKRNYTDLKYL